MPQYSYEVYYKPVNEKKTIHVGVYAFSKLEAEKIVLRNYPGAKIVKITKWIAKTKHNVILGKKFK